jgi:hypothetical protein
MQLSESWRRHIEPVIVGAAFEVLSTINMDLTKELILRRPTIMSRGIGNENYQFGFRSSPGSFGKRSNVCLERHPLRPSS